MAVDTADIAVVRKPCRRTEAGAAGIGDSSVYPDAATNDTEAIIADTEANAADTEANVADAEPSAVDTEDMAVDTDVMAVNTNANRRHRCIAIYTARATPPALKP